jgi:hypothetical protein
MLLPLGQLNGLYLHLLCRRGVAQSKHIVLARCRGFGLLIGAA